MVVPIILCEICSSAYKYVGPTNRVKYTSSIQTQVRTGPKNNFFRHVWLKKHANQILSPVFLSRVVSVLQFSRRGVFRRCQRLPMRALSSRSRGRRPSWKLSCSKSKMRLEAVLSRRSVSGHLRRVQMRTMPAWL